MRIVNALAAAVFLTSAAADVHVGGQQSGGWAALLYICAVLLVFLSVGPAGAAFRRATPTP